ncbi:MAG: hypothetical protein AB1656_17095 [Candidatus Omnitrophota bacterium]
MPDEIMKELWKIKDDIAQEHGYDVDALIAHLRERRGADDRRVVDLSARKKSQRTNEFFGPKPII